MGVLKYTNGDCYEGDLKDNQKHGHGTLTYADGGRYVGEWENNQRSGQGTNTWANGNEYQGEWQGSKQHGQGTFKYATGGSYVGQWANNMRDGHGVNTWSDGDRYTGHWTKNKKHGQGVYEYADRGIYKGQWIDDTRGGQGINTWSNGERYEGLWKNNKKHGQGTFYKTDGTVQAGDWVQDHWAPVGVNPTLPGCSLKRLAKEFVESLNWFSGIFEPSGDRCYCTECYRANWKDVIVAGGESYVIPRGFSRFGLAVDSVFANAHSLWDKWIVTFHGTSRAAAISIITHRQFCLPGDKLLDGTALGIRKGHIPNQRYIFTSPTIAYSSSPVYSPSYDFCSSHDDKTYEAQIVLQCRQKPNSFSVQRETIGLGEKQICPFIANETMEYFTDIRSSLVAYGLLIRVREKPC